MIKAIDDIVPSATDIQGSSISGPDQAGKRFVHCDSADDFSSLGIERDDFVFAVPGVQNGNDRFARV